MSTLMSRGADALVRRMKAAAGVSVTYTRGVTSAALTPWVGRTLFARQPTDPGGAAAVWGDRDYLLAVADLAAAGFAAPQKGDRLTETIAGTPVTFEVTTPDTGEPAWRYADQTRAIYRLHVKRVS